MQEPSEKDLDALETWWREHNKPALKVVPVVGVHEDESAVKWRECAMAWKEVATTSQQQVALLKQQRNWLLVLAAGWLVTLVAWWRW